MEIKADNFFKIEGWMRTELDLKGNELMAYALIYSFEQAYNKPFNASQSYIADWLGIDRRNVTAVLQRLENKEIIKKQQQKRGSVSINFYSCTGDETSPAPVMKHHRSCDETSPAPVMKHHTETNNEYILNKYINKNVGAFAPSNELQNSKSNNSKSSKPKQTNEPKQPTDAETKKFVKPTREQIVEYCETKDIHIDIDEFLDYYESNGWRVGRNPMKNWKRTVNRWWRKEQERNANRYNDRQQIVREDKHSDYPQIVREDKHYDRPQQAKETFNVYEYDREPDIIIN